MPSGFGKCVAIMPHNGCCALPAPAHHENRALEGNADVVVIVIFQHNGRPTYLGVAKSAADNRGEKYDMHQQAMSRLATLKRHAPSIMAA